MASYCGAYCFHMSVTIAPHRAIEHLVVLVYFILSGRRSKWATKHTIVHISPLLWNRPLHALADPCVHAFFLGLSDNLHLVCTLSFQCPASPKRAASPVSPKLQKIDFFGLDVVTCICILKLLGLDMLLWDRSFNRISLWSTSVQWFDATSFWTEEWLRYLTSYLNFFFGLVWVIQQKWCSMVEYNFFTFSWYDRT